MAAIILSLISYGSAAEGEFCEVMAENLLQDPIFVERNSAGHLKYWKSSQHAGEPSFEVVIDDGELTINKTGTQPWFYFRQNVAAKKLAGKKMALTAELKLNMQHPPTRSENFVRGNGLNIAARSQGRKLLLRSIMDHEIRSGKTDWYPVQVVFKVPGNSSTVDVGFAHQADGTFQVRNPSFQLVDESSKPCAISPNAILGVPRAPSGLR
ncbi:MAG: hypothetical protein V7696_18285 [Halioglobus sp.]